VAHNARFDYAFIKNEFKRAGRKFSAKCLCTVRLSRALYPRAKHHDLSTLIERHGFTCVARHRAYDDAAVLWDFLQLCESKHGPKLAPAIDKILQHSSLPQFLDTSTVEKLPETPGVYIFYGPDDEPLYIGKSRNLRYRVLSHFSGDHADTKEMVVASQVARVETRETAGELSALLLESSLIKSMHPIYNRMLRKRRELVIARRTVKDGYASVVLERVEGIEASEYTEILGVFKSIAQAKQFLSDAAKEYSLCKRILGLEKVSTNCFSYQLGTCLGACSGVEDSETYSQRFALAFKARRLRAWPYQGAIMVEEKKDDIEKHSFVLDNWCLLGDAHSGEDGFEFRARVAEFDYDSYKIFARYLRDPLYQKNIRPLPQREFQQFLSAHHDDEPVIS
jgi:DNA polymerase-3 subunit epsilon